MNVLIVLTSSFLLYTHAAVQILFVPERKHWVATAYRDGEVLLYDSLFPGSLTPSTEEQLVRLLSTSSEGQLPQGDSSACPATGRGC